MAIAPARIRPDERRAVVVAFGALFCLMSAHALVETARDALFLGALPATRLPWVYLALAAIGLVVGGLRMESGGRRTLVGWLVASGVACLVFWSFDGGPEMWVPPALYLWSGVSISVAVLLLWQAISGQFPVHAAKRVFDIIAAGGVLGAIAGALAGGAVAAVVPVHHLLLGAGALYFVAAGVALAVGAAPGRAVRGAPFRVPRHVLVQDLQTVFSDHYAGRLVALGGVAAMVFTCVDFAFKARVAEMVSAPQLGTFFASFYAATNIAALAIQLLVSGALIRALGGARALAVLPLMLVTGAAGLIAGGGLWAGVALKGAEGSLKHTLHRTSLEVLYVPVAELLRAKARRIADLLVHRLGQGLASLILLGLLAMGGGTKSVAALVIVLATAWLWLASGLRNHYLGLFRGVLQRSAAVGRTALPALDLGALETLVAALSSEDDQEVLAAMDLLASRGRARLIPSLILHHPSPQVVVRALELLGAADRTDHLTKASRLISHAEPQVRAAAVRAQPDRQFARGVMHDEDPVVRSVALAVVAGDGGPDSAEAAAGLARIAREGTLAERIALARSIAPRPPLGSVQRQMIRALAAAPERAVRAAVADLLASCPDPDLLPEMVALVEGHQSRAAARRALVAIGEPAVQAVATAMCDPNTPPKLRIHLPAVLGALPYQPAADVLCQELLATRSGVLQYRILRALNRLNGLSAPITLPEDILLTAVEQEIKASYKLTDWRMVLAAGAETEPSRRTPGHELLAGLLRDKLANGQERMFRLLDLIYTDDDFEEIYRGLLSENPTHKSSSIELLEHVLPTRIRNPIVGLYDSTREALPREERLAPGAPLHPIRDRDYEAVIRDMLGGVSDAVQAVAAYHVGELQLYELQQDLNAIDLSQHPDTAEVIENALHRLGAVEPTDGQPIQLDEGSR